MAAPRDPKAVSQGLEILQLRRQVAELSWDSAFGMLTRAAFLRDCRSLPPETYWVVFIDLDDIGVLNLTYGYAEVDRRVRLTFQPLQARGIVAARWYSGDEIVLRVPRRDDPQAVLSDLRRRAGDVGISFVDVTGEWQAGEAPIQTLVEALSMQICTIKQPAALPARPGGQDA
jgi:GGDEF domain-containing protein